MRRLRLPPHELVHERLRPGVNSHDHFRQEPKHHDQRQHDEEAAERGGFEEGPELFHFRGERFRRRQGFRRRAKALA